MTDVPSDISPFDAYQTADDSASPALEQVLDEAVRRMGLITHVCFPATITAIHGNQLVDIQPLFKSRFVDASVIPMPGVCQVPVIMPMGAGYSQKVPIAIGDAGLALVSDKSLETWSQSNGTTIVDPLDQRTHALSDCVFLPGLYPAAGQTKDVTTDFVVTNGQAVLRIEKTGRFKLTNGTNELVDLTCQLASAVITLCDTLGSAQTLTNTMMGPQPFLAATQALLQSQKATAQTILTRLNTLKG